MSEPKNLGTSQATGDVSCKACGYVADVRTYKPTASVYNDIKCPRCGSTNNEHNSEYSKRLQENMRRSSQKEKKNETPD